MPLNFGRVKLLRTALLAAPNLTAGAAAASFSAGQPGSAGPAAEGGGRGSSSGAPVAEGGDLWARWRPVGTAAGHAQPAGGQAVWGQPRCPTSIPLPAPPNSGAPPPRLYWCPVSRAPHADLVRAVGFFRALGPNQETAWNAARIQRSWRKQ